jgi:hypothetical protein
MRTKMEKPNTSRERINQKQLAPGEFIVGTRVVRSGERASAAAEKPANDDDDQSPSARLT